jgi:TonB-linked SusC/RagA family outer membrane protein
MGMETKRVEVNNRSRINVVLQDDSQLLDAAVVIGYGTSRKSDLTGSVASISAKKLNDTPSHSIDGLLQGRVAGVQVINDSQDPGASSVIRIRGNSSLNASNSPLVVVDGFPLGEAGDIKQINPQDIVSMEVLKDASSAAIYGSRGANGVILITTRKAGENINHITVRQQTTMSSFTSDLDLWRDPVLMAILSNESYLNGGLTPLYTGTASASGIYYPSVEELQTTWNKFTNWDDIVFRNHPVSNNTTLQISSGNKRTQFIAGANYYTDNGMYKESAYKKAGANFSVSHNIFDNLTIKMSANYIHSKKTYDLGTSYGRNPIFPVYNEDGSFFQYSASDYYNPVAIRNTSYNNGKSDDFLGYAYAEWKILPELTLKGQLDYKHGESISDAYYAKKYTESGTFNNGYGYISNWKDDKIVAETYATYDKLFAKKHHLKAMLGYSYEHYQTRSSMLGAVDFVNETLGNENLEAGNPESYRISNSLTRTELVSGMARLNYIYNDKYLATFTARLDGSSKFGKDNKYAFFPSGALSWKMQNEDFIKKLNIFDILKLRVSYGFSGNQGISAYQTLSRYGQHKYYNMGSWVTAIGPGYQSGYTGDDYRYALWAGIANSSLKWETTGQFDIGLETAFFKRRLNITFDYYDKQTKDLLRQCNIAPSSGYDQMWVNDGKIQNRGIELTIDGTIYRNNDWNISGTLVYSRNRNKVKSLGNTIKAGLKTDPNTGMQYEYYGASLGQFRGYPNLLAVGKPMYVFYGYKVKGIVQTYAEGLSNGLVGSDAYPGEFNYIDTDESGTVDENDRTIIGDPNPDFCASLALNITWKNMDFGVFFNGVFGNDVLDCTKFTKPSALPKRWTEDNPTNNYPRLNTTRQTKLSDWWIEDGSFVRIQNITFGYTVPVFKTTTGHRCRIYLSADNLYTFTKFDGYDPEVSQKGIYSGGYPRLRKWTLGIDFTF